MPTREQLTAERTRAILRLIAEENETPAGKLPTPDYLDRLQRTRDLGEADQICEWCERAGEELKTRDSE